LPGLRTTSSPTPLSTLRFLRPSPRACPTHTNLRSPACSCSERAWQALTGPLGGLRREKQIQRSRAPGVVHYKRQRPREACRPDHSAPQPYPIPRVGSHHSRWLDAHLSRHHRYGVRLGNEGTRPDISSSSYRHCRLTRTSCLSTSALTNDLIIGWIDGWIGGWVASNPQDSVSDWDKAPPFHLDSTVCVKWLNNDLRVCMLLEPFQVLHLFALALSPRDTRLGLLEQNVVYSPDSCSCSDCRSTSQPGGKVPSRTQCVHSSLAWLCMGMKLLTRPFPTDYTSSQPPLDKSQAPVGIPSFLHVSASGKVRTTK